MAKIVNLPLTGSLVDSYGNLTDGKLLRASGATYIGPDGVLRYSKGSRLNAILYSEDLSQNFWAKSHTSISGTSGIICDDETTTHYVRARDVLVGNATNIYSFKVKAGLWNYLKVQFSPDAGSFRGIVNVVTGTIVIKSGAMTIEFGDMEEDGYRKLTFSYPIGSVATSNDLYFLPYETSEDNNTQTGDGTSVVLYIKEVQLEALPDLATTYDIVAPAVYTPTSGAAVTIPAEPRFEKDGLLIEGAATNLIAESEDFSAWSPQAGVTLSTGHDGPNGQPNAFGIIPAAVEQSQLVQLNVNGLADDADYTYSAYFKKGAEVFGRIMFTDKENRFHFGYFNLDTGTTGGKSTSLSDTTSIKPLSNGWYRCSLNFNMSNGATQPKAIAASCHEDNVFTSTGDGTTVGVYIFGAQLEATPYPTSYIPTAGAAVSRATEAGNSGVSGVSWTTGSTVKSAISTAVGSAVSKFTCITEWYPRFNSYALPANEALLTTRDGNDGLFYLSTTSGRIITTDGTNYPSRTPAWSIGDALVLVARGDSTVVAPTTGALVLSAKVGGAWQHGTIANYDGAIVYGTYVHLAYAGIHSYSIKNIVMYDTYLSDAQIEAEIWKKTPRAIGMGCGRNFL